MATAVEKIEKLSAAGAVVGNTAVRNEQVDHFWEVTVDGSKILMEADGAHISEERMMTELMKMLLVAHHAMGRINTDNSNTQKKLVKCEVGVIQGTYNTKWYVGFSMVSAAILSGSGMAGLIPKQAQPILGRVFDLSHYKDIFSSNANLAAEASRQFGKQLMKGGQGLSQIFQVFATCSQHSNESARTISQSNKSLMETDLQQWKQSSNKEGETTQAMYQQLGQQQDRVAQLKGETVR